MLQLAREFKPESRPVRYWMDWYERRKNLLLGAPLAVEWQLIIAASNCIPTRALKAPAIAAMP